MVKVKRLKSEKYKGYPLKFVKKILNGKPGKKTKQIVIGEVPSRVTNKMYTANGKTKKAVKKKLKRMINNEV